MSRLTRYHALGLMVLCLLTAAVLRLPNLETVPPGMHYDEAANGVLVSEIAFEGERPIFIPSYTGKDVLFFYLAGGLTRLVGSSIFTLRLTSAFVALLTIAATYWLGREMLADRRIALLAAALLAVSFWHLLFSRLGFRVITEPLLQALTIAALFRGLRSKQWPWLLLAGVFLGLTAYTYLSARLFPVLLLAAALPLLFSYENMRIRWQQLIFVGLVALLIILPLVAYFQDNPAAFWVRIGQVAPGQNGNLPIIESLLKSLGMYFLVGDPYIRFNIPERPLFGWFWGGLLLVGWLICLLRYRRYFYDWQRAALVLLLLAPLVMLLPTALAVNEIVPSNLRAIGLIPFVFYLPAIGLIALLQDLGRRLHIPPLTSAVQMIVLLLLIGGGAYVHHLYFEQWATSPELLYEADGDLAAAADYLDQTDTTGKTVYVAAVHYRHPTLAFLSEKYPTLKWLPGSETLVFPATGEALYIYPHNSPAAAWSLPYLQGGALVHQGTGTQGQPLFDVYQLSQQPALNITHPLNVNFGNAITLLGYDLQPAAAGETMFALLYWRVEARPPVGNMANPVPFIHLEDNWGYRWSQAETGTYPAEQWEPGEVIAQQIAIPILPGTPPGEYRLRVGLFDPGNGSRLSRLDEGGRFQGDTYPIDNVPITAGMPPDILPRPSFPVNQTAVSGLRLLGYERGRTTAAAGDFLDVALWWSAERPLPPMQRQLLLTGQDELRVPLVEDHPAQGSYPFTEWTTPQFVIDRQTVQLPDDLPAGAYRLALRLVGEGEETLYAVDLGLLRTEATERVFTRPPVTNLVEASFGQEIMLVGYDLDSDRVANSHRLTLIWQAQTRPSHAYTVFVHLLHPDGACCVWQQDVMPRQNSYPTDRWLADEVVSDVYQIDLPADLPAGEYPLEVGLYLAETGQRLAVTQNGQPDADAVFLPPLSVGLDETP